MIKRQTLLAILALGTPILIAPNGALASGGFTFRDAEFMPADRATSAARSFVETQLPPGLPLSEARERLARADMHCDKPQRPDAPTLCDFSELVHNDGGIIGEDHFTLRLHSARGLLVSAELDHFNIGTGNPNP